MDIRPYRIFCIHAYRLNAAMYQICHCEAVGRGNLQHRSVMTDAPINIEHVGFTMLIGWMPGGAAVLEIPTGFALGMTDLGDCAYYRSADSSR